MPVEAVTPLEILYLLRYLMNSFKTYVFPVPADPVKNTFLPDFNMSSANSCVTWQIYIEMSWFK